MIRNARAPEAGLLRASFTAVNSQKGRLLVWRTSGLASLAVSGCCFHRHRRDAWHEFLMHRGVY